MVKVVSVRVTMAAGMVTSLVQEADLTRGGHQSLHTSEVTPTVARIIKTSPRTPTDDLQPRDRTLDANVPRLALGEGPQAVRRHRGRQARARGHRVHRHPAGLRPQDNSPRPAGPGSSP